jgi:hypothetical protein
MVQQSTESFPPDYRAISSVTIGLLDQPLVKTLMRAIDMVLTHVLADEFSQVRLAQRDDAVETLLFDRDDESPRRWTVRQAGGTR